MRIWDNENKKKSIDDLVKEKEWSQVVEDSFVNLGVRQIDLEEIVEKFIQKLKTIPDQKYLQTPAIYVLDELRMFARSENRKYLYGTKLELRKMTRLSQNKRTVLSRYKAHFLIVRALHMQGEVRPNTETIEEYAKTKNSCVEIEINRAETFFETVTIDRLVTTVFEIVYNVATYYVNFTEEDLIRTDVTNYVPTYNFRQHIGREGYSSKDTVSGQKERYDAVDNVNNKTSSNPVQKNNRLMRSTSGNEKPRKSLQRNISDVAQIDAIQGLSMLRNGVLDEIEFAKLNNVFDRSFKQSSEAKLRSLGDMNKRIIGEIQNTIDVMQSWFDLIADLVAFEQRLFEMVVLEYHVDFDYIMDSLEIRKKLMNECGLCRSDDPGTCAAEPVLRKAGVQLTSSTMETENESLRKHVGALREMFDIYQENAVGHFQRKLFEIQSNMVNKETEKKTNNAAQAEETLLEVTKFLKEDKTWGLEGIDEDRLLKEQTFTIGLSFFSNLVGEIPLASFIIDPLVGATAIVAHAYLFKEETYRRALKKHSELVRQVNALEQMIKAATQQRDIYRGENKKDSFCTSAYLQSIRHALILTHVQLIVRMYKNKTTIEADKVYDQIYSQLSTKIDWVRGFFDNEIAAAEYARPFYYQAYCYDIFETYNAYDTLELHRDFSEMYKKMSMNAKTKLLLGKIADIQKDFNGKAFKNKTNPVLCYHSKTHNREFEIRNIRTGDLSVSEKDRQIKELEAQEREQRAECFDHRVFIAELLKQNVKESDREAAIDQVAIVVQKTVFNLKSRYIKKMLLNTLKTKYDELVGITLTEKVFMENMDKTKFMVTEEHIKGENLYTHISENVKKVGLLLENYKDIINFEISDTFHASNEAIFEDLWTHYTSEIEKFLNDKIFIPKKTSRWEMLQTGMDRLRKIERPKKKTPFHVIIYVFDYVNTTLADEIENANLDTSKMYDAFRTSGDNFNTDLQKFFQDLIYSHRYQKMGETAQVHMKAAFGEKTGARFVDEEEVDFPPYKTIQAYSGYRFANEHFIFLHAALHDLHNCVLPDGEDSKCLSIDMMSESDQHRIYSYTKLKDPEDEQNK